MNTFDNEDDDANDDIIDDQFQQDDGLEEGQQNDDGQQQQQAAPVAQSFNPADIASIVAATMQAHREPPQQRQMTAEEAAAHYQVWNPEERFVNDLNKLTDSEVPLAERQALLAQMRDGMVNQAFRGAELLMEQKMAELDQRYAPALAIAQQQEARQLKSSFEKKYPALKGQDELINSITAGLSQQGFKPKSPDEAFDKVAEFAEQILKKVNPDFKLGKPQSGGGSRTPTMAGANMGGHSGGFQTQRSANAPQKRGGLASIFK